MLLYRGGLAIRLCSIGFVSPNKNSQKQTTNLQASEGAAGHFLLQLEFGACSLHFQQGEHRGAWFSKLVRNAGEKFMEKDGNTVKDRRRKRETR